MAKVVGPGGAKNRQIINVDVGELLAVLEEVVH